MRYSKDESRFLKINSEESAYWFGFLLADGYLRFNPSLRCYRIGIELQYSDIDHLGLFAKYVGYNGPIRERYRQTFGKYHRHAVIDICSKSIASQLLNVGWNEFHNGDISKALDSATCYQRHFIRGFFDGDGALFAGTAHAKGAKTISHRPFAEFVSPHQSILNSLNSIVSRSLGINSNSVYKYCNSCYLVKWTCGNAVKLLHWMYDNATVSLTRKRELAYKLIADEEKFNANIIQIRNAKLDAIKLRNSTLLSDSQSMSVRELINKYSISQTQVYRILNGHTPVSA